MPGLRYHILARSHSAAFAGFSSLPCCRSRVLFLKYGSFLASSPALRSALLFHLQAPMDPSPGPKYLPNPMLFGAEVVSDPGLDPRVSGKTQTPKLDMSRSGLGIQKTGFSELVRKRTRDARAMSIADAALPARSSYRPGEQFALPLRLALAQRSVKNQIFTYMDQGDKKAEIESRTGLSHQCIKWYRRMWRAERSHPRPQSRKLPKSSARRPRSPNTRNERASRKRRRYEDQSDSSVVGNPSGSKRRRLHRTVKQPKGCSLRAGMEVSEVGGRDFAERKTRGLSPSQCKEDIPERDEAMSMSGELMTLPIRDLGP